MNAYRLLVAFGVLLGAACSDKVGNFGIDLVGPRVVAVSPAAGATNVDFSDPVLVSLSEPVDPATVAVSFQIATEAGEILPGTVQLDGLDATFTPSARWEYLSSYNVSVSVDLRDLAGNQLEAEFSSDFLTRDLAWTGTVAVSTTTDNSAYASGPIIDIVDGHAFVAWDSINAWVSRRSPTGVWEAPLKVSDPAGGFSEDTTVAVLGSNAVIVWAQQDPTLTRIDVSARILDLAGLSPPEPVENSTSTVSSPVLASDGVASAIAAFDYSGTSTPVRQATFDTSVGWVTPTSLQMPTGDGEFPDVAMSRAGNSTAIWRQVNGAETDVYASHRPSGGNFSPPTILDTVTTYPSNLHVVARGDSGALAVWLQDVGGSNDLFASRYEGTWDSPMVLSSAGLGYCVATNDAGDALVVFGTSSGYRSAHFRGNAVTFTDVGTASPAETACFLDDRGNGGFLSLEVTGGSGDLLFRRYLAESGWSEPTPAESDDDGSVEAGSSASGIDVDCSGNGRAAVVWFRLPAAGGTKTTVWSSSFE